MGVGKQLSARAPEGLGGAPASGGGWRGECSGVGRCMGVGVEEEERVAENGGTGGRWTGALAWSGARASASKKRSAGLGTVGAGLKIFNPRRAFITDLITAGSN